jgi:ABC-type antimicrobial peptide transport system permease subunit
MIKNYLKTICRNISRYSAYTILNVAGMAIGMASAILIILWVQDEMSYDSHFKNGNDLYRVIEKQHFSGGKISQFAISPGMLAATLKKEYPEIVRSARYSNPQFPLQNGNEFIEAKTAIVDSEFLEMFDIKFLRGDINSSMNGPFDIVITDKLASKYFSNQDPVGKTLKSGAWVLTVKGVVKCLPYNSHLEFDVLFPSEFLKQIGVPSNDWGYRCYNYLQLQKGTDSEIFNGKISDFIGKNERGSNSEILLQNIKKIHLFSSQKYTYDISGQGDIIYVRVLSLVALFILIIACINFMNLSTTISAKRTRGIGIRKVYGAGKMKIIIQFLGESLLIVLVAHTIAMIIVELVLPEYNIMIGKNLRINYQSIELYVGLFSMIMFCSLLAGSYPSIYMASLNPINMIKGIGGTKPVGAKFRSILVIFQFTISIMLIICTLIVGRQLHYLRNMNLGYDRENIGYFLFDTNPRDPSLETFKKEIINNPDILSVTRSHYNPVNVEGTWTDLNWTGKKEEDVKFFVLGADEDYARTFHLQIKEGRYFSSEFPTDKTGIVINEEAANVMGLVHPVGEIISTGDGAKFTIIGVVKDFNFRSLHSKIEPLIMCLESCNTFYIKMKPDKTTSTIEFINKIYKTFNNPNPLHFHFLDDDFVNLYQTEQKIAKILGYFSFLAIIISCLGLIGLSSFITERRTKEIGIRKINGAKPGEIFSLFSREYIICVFISIVLACPIAGYTMSHWLQNFAFKINISWLIFAFAGGLAFLIALITVSAQSFKAACKNPVEALRYE